MPWSPDDQPVDSCWSRSRGSAALELLSALISVMEQNAGEQGSSVTHGLLQHHKNQYVSFLSLSSSVYIAGLLGNPLFLNSSLDDLHIISAEGWKNYMMNLNKTEAPSTPRMMNHETYHEYIVFKKRRQNNRKTDSQTESIQIYRAINR